MAKIMAGASLLAWNAGRTLPEAMVVGAGAENDAMADFNGRESYLNACQEEGTCAVARLLEKIDEPLVDLRHYYLGPRGARAVRASERP